MRSLAIDEKAYGPDHQQAATDLNNLAALLGRQEKCTEAIPLLERILSINTEKFGENHPDTLATRNGLELAQERVKHSEAMRLPESAHSIRSRRLGENYHSTADTQASLERVRNGAEDVALPVLVSLGGIALGLLLFFTK